MDYYAGIDVSLELSSVCAVDSSGKIVRETKVASEPEALLRHFADLGLPIVSIDLEAGPLSQWLREGLVDAGLDVVLLETRHVQAALSAMPVKTDRKDARGIGELVSMHDGGNLAKVSWGLLHPAPTGKLISGGKTEARMPTVANLYTVSICEPVSAHWRTRLGEISGSVLGKGILGPETWRGFWRCGRWNRLYRDRKDWTPSY